MELHLILMYIIFYIGLFAFVFYVISMRVHSKQSLNQRKEAIDKDISVIIPAYNEENSIKRTLESITNIDYPYKRIEIIVVDDGSNDKTLEEIKNFKESYKGKILIKFFSKENNGKGSAINYGLKEAKGEIIFTMDADSFVQPDAVKKMVAKFDDLAVMCVAPSILVYKPKKILQKICHAEYFIGIFLRKAFSSVDSIHITPGAFSSYRKSFFDKFGGFDENNLTEDMEIALRVQSKGYKIDYSIGSRVYTINPWKFKALLLQRRRWYVGLIKNLWKYKNLFGPKTGVMGIFVLPVALISIVFGLILFIILLLRALSDIHNNFIILKSINFNFGSFIDINKYFIENLLYSFFSKPQIVMLILFLFMLGFYSFFARKKSGHTEKMKFNIALFLIFYSFLFAFWWIISGVYVILNKPINWGGNVHLYSKNKK